MFKNIIYSESDYTTKLSNNLFVNKINNFKLKYFDRANKVDKSKISLPTNFRLVEDIELSNKIQEILSELGLANHKINRRTKLFIDEFIERNGGVERFSKELKELAEKNRSSALSSDCLSPRPLSQNLLPPYNTKSEETLSSNLLNEIRKGFKLKDIKMNDRSDLLKNDDYPIKEAKLSIWDQLKFELEKREHIFKRKKFIAYA